MRKQAVRRGSWLRGLRAYVLLGLVAAVCGGGSRGVDGPYADRGVYAHQVNGGDDGVV